VYEPFGLINLEAMACETPVVATRVGGITEVVADWGTGVLEPPARPAELAAAIRALLAAPARARTRGGAGRPRAGERRTCPRGAERTERGYAEALDAARAHAP